MKNVLIAVCLLAASTIQVQAKIERPKLVVGLVVDQMRWDYLYYYYDKFQEGGLKRLVDQGYSYENTMIDYIPTITAVGHTSIYTGTCPAFHGITGNNFHVDGKNVYCCTDTNVQGVGSKSKEAQMSPHRLKSTGIGDMLKMATDQKAKVIGVALKDRAAILPAGFSADGAYWWDTSVGHFVTSTYYCQELPEWVKKINKKIGTKPGFDVKSSNMGVTKTFEMAEAAIENEQMGQDDITDLLAVSVSSTDVIGHAYGTRGNENEGVYMELDKQLAHFFEILDSKVGKGNYLLFLTADHGAEHNHNVLKSHKIPAGGLQTKTFIKEVNKTIGEQLGTSEQIISDEIAGSVYLNHSAIEKTGKTVDEVKAMVIAEFNKNPNILFTVDYNKILTSPIPQLIRERVVNGYMPSRSGDLLYIAREGWENVSNKPDYTGTTHGMWNPSDSHIPFILYGWHVNHGESSEPTKNVDIAPTICEMLHIQMPNSCVGNAKLSHK